MGGDMECVYSAIYRQESFWHAVRSTGKFVRGEASNMDAS